MKVQKGESFKPSLNEWLDNREWPMRNLLNCIICDLCRSNFLNQILLRILGVMSLYLEAKFAGKLFQYEDHILEI